MLLLASAAGADRLDGPGVLGQAARDRIAAVKAQRPHAPRMPGLGELGQFKGFTAEQSFLHRMNANAPEGVRWEPGPRNDPVVDHVLVNADGSRTAVQQYAGKHPRAAFEKLLGSDAAADELFVPSDVEAKMRRAVREVEAVAASDLDDVDKARQYRRRLKGTGLSVEGGELVASTKVGRRSLGALGTGETAAAMGRLKPETLTSSQVEQRNLQGMLRDGSSPSLEKLTKAVGLSEERLAKMLNAELDGRGAFHRAKGETPMAAARKAGKWLTDSRSPDVRKRIAASEDWAKRSGFDGEELRAISKAAAGSKGGKQSLNGYLAEVETRTRTAVAKARVRTASKTAAVEAAFVLAAAGYEVWAVGWDAWRDGGGVGRTAARSGTAVAAGAAGPYVMREPPPKVTKGRKIPSKGGWSRVGRTAKGLGLATAVLVAGESLYAVFGEGRSIGEVGDGFFEEVPVWLRTTVAGTTVAGTVVAELAAYAGAGSWAGPVGVAVAVGVGVGWEAWRYTDDFDANQAIFRVRAERARERVRTYGGGGRRVSRP